MDLSGIKPAETGFLHLEHPATGEKLNTEEGQPIGINLYGVDSPAYRRAKARIANRNLSKKNKQVTFEKFDEGAIELLAACTESFQNVMIEGQQMTAKDAAAIYAEHQWIREQVDEFVGDRNNFFLTA